LAESSAADYNQGRHFRSFFRRQEELIMPQHIYPRILTQDDWQKKKGTIAKMAGKTGVGEAMAALQKAYEKTNWKIFNPDEALGLSYEFRNKESLAMVIKNAKAEYKTNIQGGILPALEELRKKVTKAKASFEKSKVIPKKAGEHAAKVLEAIDRLEEEVATTLVDELKKVVERRLKDIQAAEEIYSSLKEKLKYYLLELAKDMKTVKTKTDFDSCWSNHIRGVGTTLPNLAKQLGLEEELKLWRGFASENFKPRTDEQVAGKFEEMRPVMRQIVAKLK